MNGVFTQSVVQDDKRSSFVLSVSEESSLRVRLADFDINGGKRSYRINVSRPTSASESADKINSGA